MSILLSQIVSTITGLNLFRESVESLAPVGRNGVFTLAIEENKTTHIGGAGDIDINTDCTVRVYDVYSGEDLLRISVDVNSFAVAKGNEVLKCASLHDLEQIVIDTLSGFLADFYK